MSTILLIAVAFSCCLAQQRGAAAPPSQSPDEREQQEAVQVFTEEVLLPVVAYDEYGRYDPTVAADDLLILEDNVPQQVRSVRRIPANILLVFDLGSQITSVTGVTRDFALKLIDSLRESDQLAIVQNSKKVELLQDWTTDTEKAAQVIKTQLFPSQRSRLSEWLMKAVMKVKEKPVGNTHVVLVTDGIEAFSNRSDYQTLTESLSATQATAHVIAYTAYSREALKSRHFGLDFQMKRWYEQYGETLKQNDERLTTMVREVGGRLMLPVTTEEIVNQSDEVVRDIKSQYIVTYSPRRPYASTGNPERRQVKVFPRRLNLQLTLMKNYVNPAPDHKN